jgi:hypothetical protein
MSAFPWFRVDNELVDNAKVDHLAGLLYGEDANWAAALGHVIAFWCWASKTAATGLFSVVARPSIERSCGWRGERGALFAALVTAGFVDDLGDGEFEVHDWDEKQGSILAKAQRDKDRMAQKRADKAAKRVARPSTRRSRVTRRDETFKRLPEAAPPGSEQRPLPLIVAVSSAPAPQGEAFVLQPSPAPTPVVRSPHSDLCDALPVIYEQQFGEKYPFTPRDGVVVASMLKKFEPYEIASRWRRALAAKGFPKVRKLSELESNWAHFAAADEATGFDPNQGIMSRAF